jgi:hypothetical protein
VAYRGCGVRVAEQVEAGDEPLVEDCNLAVEHERLRA